MGKREILKKYLQHAGMVLFIVLAVLISVPGVYTGFKWIAKGRAYRHFDSEKALDMLLYIKEINPAHYLKIISPEDSTQLKAIEEMFTTEGDKETVALCIFIIIASILASAVILLLAVLLFQVLSIKRKLSNGDEEPSQKAGDESVIPPGKKTEQKKEIKTAPEPPAEQVPESTTTEEFTAPGLSEVSEEYETSKAVAELLGDESETVEFMNTAEG